MGFTGLGSTALLKKAVNIFLDGLLPAPGSKLALGTMPIQNEIGR
jgi:hypothetical protein